MAMGMEREGEGEGEEKAPLVMHDHEHQAKRIPAGAPVTNTTTKTKPALRGVSHQAACVGSAMAGVALIRAAPEGKITVSVAVYAASLVCLFGVSAVYHQITWTPEQRRIARRVDHAAIFVLIAGTYTPIATVALQGPAADACLALVWSVCLAGVGLSVFWPDAPKALVAFICVAYGCAGAWEWSSFAAGLSHAEVALIASGGALYAVGAWAYAARRPDPWPLTFGYHEVFHALTIAATACHFAAIWLLATR